MGFTFKFHDGIAKSVQYTHDCLIEWGPNFSSSLSILGVPAYLKKAGFRNLDRSQQFTNFSVSGILKKRSCFCSTFSRFGETCHFRERNSSPYKTKVLNPYQIPLYRLIHTNISAHCNPHITG